MAKKIILGLGRETVYRLMNLRWFVHIEFIDDDLYEKAVSLGFDKEAWEIKNNNQVLIKYHISDIFEKHKQKRIKYYINN
jgi:hypothetical protein